jgi:hypothetical protein
MWREKETFGYCWWEYKLVQLLWKSVWRYLKKLKIELQYGPTLPLLDIYPKEYKSICNIFIATLFIRAKI